MSGAPSSSVQGSPSVEGSSINPGPGEVRSNLTEEELGLVRARFFFSSDFVLETANPEDRIICPPLGRVGVYVETLRAGLRFPFHGFVNELLEAYNLVPAQLTPNSWRMIIGFLSLCIAHNILISVRVFRGCFMLKSSPAMKGWLYFAFRGGKPLFKGMPSSIRGWKEKYLFVISRLSWGFDPTWGVPRLRENNLLPTFNDAEEEALGALRSLEGEINIRDLLSEDALVNVGLSPASPEEIAGMVFSDETLLGRYNKRAAEAGDARVEPRLKKPRPTSDLAGGNLVTSGDVSSGPVQKGKERIEEEKGRTRDGVSAVRAGPVSASSARDPARGPRSSSSARGPHSHARHGGSSSVVSAPASVRPISSRSPTDVVPSSRGRHLGPLRDHPPSSSRDHPPSSSRASFPSSSRPSPSSSSRASLPSSSRADLPSSSRPDPPSSSRADPPSSSRPDPPSSLRTDPPSSPRGPVSSKGGRYDPRWSFSQFDSAFDDAVIAREVVRGACLPADRAQMKTGPFREIVDQAFCSAIRHLHEVEMLAEASSTFLSDARAQDKKSEVLKKRLSEALAKLGEAEARAGVAESRLEDARRRVLEVESEDALHRSALRASEARVAGLTSELTEERHEKDVLRLKLQQSEDRERVAVERAETAVERFRQSVEYQDELAEEAVDGLIRGFEDCRAQVSRYCPQYDFSGLRPRLCEADYRISSGEEGFEEDFFPEVDPVTSAEADLDAPSEVAGGVAPDADLVILPEVAASAAAAEVAASSDVVVGAAVEAAAAGPEVASAPEVVSEALALAEPVNVED